MNTQKNTSTSFVTFACSCTPRVVGTHSQRIVLPPQSNRHQSLLLFIWNYRICEWWGRGGDGVDDPPRLSLCVISRDCMFAAINRQHVCGAQSTCDWFVIVWNQPMHISLINIHTYTRQLRDVVIRSQTDTHTSQSHITITRLQRCTRFVYHILIGL